MSLPAHFSRANVPQGNTNAETDDVTKKMNAEDKSAKLAED